jgi:hypothetical protein
VPSLDDQLRAQQLAAGVDAVATVLRRIVADRPDTKITQLTKEGLALIAQEVISAYIIETARQAREHGSSLIDGRMTLG